MYVSLHSRGAERHRTAFDLPDLNNALNTDVQMCRVWRSFTSRHSDDEVILQM